MLLKACHYGIRGKLNDWLCDFLSDHWQDIVVNESCSEWSNVSSGVPQGTVLSLVLFLLSTTCPQAYHLKLGCSLMIQFCSNKSVALTITTAYSIISTNKSSGLLSYRWDSHSPFKFFLLSVTLHTTCISSHFSDQLSDTYLEEVKYFKYLLGVYMYITSSLS